MVLCNSVYWMLLLSSGILGTMFWFTSWSPWYPSSYLFHSISCDHKPFLLSALGSMRATNVPFTFIYLSAFNTSSPWLLCHVRTGHVEFILEGSTPPLYVQGTKSPALAFLRTPIPIWLLLKSKLQPVS